MNEEEARAMLAVTSMSGLPLEDASEITGEGVDTLYRLAGEGHLKSRMHVTFTILTEAETAEELKLEVFGAIARRSSPVDNLGL